MGLFFNLGNVVTLVVSVNLPIIIKLQGVEKTLGGQPVLKGVNLDIPKGNITTIIGPSGDGKSVML